MRRQIAASKAALWKSVGALLQVGALVALLGLLPYTLFSAYGLYQAAAAFGGDSIGSLVYQIARFSGCIVLIYALWRLRQAGLRLRNSQLS